MTTRLNVLYCKIAYTIIVVCGAAMTSDFPHTTVYPKTPGNDIAMHRRLSTLLYSPNSITRSSRTSQPPQPPP
jgi:hypothetical protein